MYTSANFLLFCFFAFFDDSPFPRYRMYRRRLASMSLRSLNIYYFSELMFFHCSLRFLICSRSAQTLPIPIYDSMLRHQAILSKCSPYQIEVRRNIEIANFRRISNDYYLLVFLSITAFSFILICEFPFQTIFFIFVFWWILNFMQCFFLLFWEIVGFFLWIFFLQFWLWFIEWILLN